MLAGSAALLLGAAAGPAQAVSSPQAATGDGLVGTTSVPDNPADGPTGANAMHGDSLASDTTPLAGPGAGAVKVRQLALGGPCPSILIGSDGLPITLCTQALTRQPLAVLLDPARGSRLASLKLTGGGNLFAGVYPYLDAEDRLVVVDGTGKLLRIAHARSAATGAWSLRVDAQIDLTPAIKASCGSATCGGIVGLSPDWAGRAWFATQDGGVGFADPATGAVRVLQLPAGERVANSIATAPGGTAVTSDHAVYLLDAGAGPTRGADAASQPGPADAAPRIRWRSTYDRGTARKPGQLSQGSGSTPTFLGTAPGADPAGAVAFVDNAEPAEHLIVRASDDGRLLCDLPVLAPGPSGSENSPVGIDGAVIVASTFGYPYPAVPDWAGGSKPSAARLGAGVQRIDLDPSAPAGCKVRWTAPVSSAAVPKLSLADGLLYTVDRQPLTLDGHGGAFDLYALTAIDAATGKVRSKRPIAATSLADTMQLAGNIGAGGTLWQGDFAGLLRIAPAPAH